MYLFLHLQLIEVENLVSVSTDDRVVVGFCLEFQLGLGRNLEVRVFCVAPRFLGTLQLVRLLFHSLLPAVRTGSLPLCEPLLYAGVMECVHAGQGHHLSAVAEFLTAHHAHFTGLSIIDLNKGAKPFGQKRRSMVV